MLNRKYPKSRIRICKCGKETVGRQCMDCYSKGKNGNLAKMYSQRRRLKK